MFDGTPRIYFHLSTQFHTLTDMSGRERRKWPIQIKSGGHTVRIYRVPRQKAGRTYTEFRVAYYAENGRQFESFSDFESAERKAREVSATITRGDAKALTLSADERLVYQRAVAALSASNVALDVAAREYGHAKQILKGGSVLDAARHFASTHADMQENGVAEVVEEFIALREKRTSRGKPASEAYMHDLEVRLRPLGDAFAVPIHTVTPRQIEEYVDSLEPGPRSRHNLLTTIRTLFNFAQARRYFPRDVNPMEGIELAFVHEGEIGVFTAEEMRRLICAAQSHFPDLLPFLVIGGFAGLRSAEIGRLDWANVREEYLEVTAAKAKTRSRRLVPIQPNLAAWLERLRKDSGRVVDLETIAHGFGTLTAATEIKGTAKKPGKPVKWQPNGLRHSFITYRLALTKNENLVATEAGNSPQLIHHHYRELATDDQAKEWFAIEPEKENRR